MAKFLPVIGEIWTGLESLVLISSSGLAKVCGYDESASKLAKGAGNAWKDYTETNLIAATVNINHKIEIGDEEGADEVAKKLGKAFENVADSTPIVGHIKGIVHYCKGDTEKGNKCMESATRNTAVLGAGMVTGGASLSVGWGAGAGVGTGIVYDGIATGIDKGVNGNEASNRGVFGLKDAANSDDPNQFFGVLMGPVGDAMSGASGNQLGKLIRNRCKLASQNSMKKHFKEKGASNPKNATKTTMNSAKQCKSVKDSLSKKREQVINTNIKDNVSKKSGSGQNYRVRKLVGKKKTRSGNVFSKKKSGSLDVGSNKTFLQKTQPEVTPDPKTPWNQSNCAEQAAFNDLGSKVKSLDVSNCTTATTRIHRGADGGTAYPMPSCGNCAKFNMGEVVTNMLPENTAIPTSGYMVAHKLKSVVGTQAGVHAFKQDME